MITLFFYFHFLLESLNLGPHFFKLLFSVFIRELATLSNDTLLWLHLVLRSLILKCRFEFSNFCFLLKSKSLSSKLHIVSFFDFQEEFSKSHILFKVFLIDVVLQGLTLIELVVVAGVIIWYLRLLAGLIALILAFN